MDEYTEHAGGQAPNWERKNRTKKKESRILMGKTANKIFFWFSHISKKNGDAEK